LTEVDSHSIPGRLCRLLTYEANIFEGLLFKTKLGMKPVDSIELEKAARNE
jgi:hypothetical protein